VGTLEKELFGKEVGVSYPKEKKVNVLSLGAGVQSSALLLAYANGKLFPKPDFAVFADTQAEPPEVYRWLATLEKEVKGAIKILRVSKGDLVTDFLNASKRAASIPLFLKNADGSQGLAWRQCTQDYKIGVVHKAVRTELGYKPRQHMKHNANMLIGISTDEALRVKDSRVKWIKNCYPLIDELKWTRGQCRAYVQSLGLPSPPRSACFMCPYRSNSEWLTMKTQQPETFAQAVRFDKATRENNRFRGEPFVHRAMVPLDEVDFAKSTGLTSPLINECEGMCGV